MKKDDPAQPCLFDWKDAQREQLFRDREQNRTMRRSLEERDELILQWRYLPKFVATKMVKNGRFVLVPFDELEQAGFIALIRAAELWDGTRGVKFVTYATNSIINHLLRMDVGGAIKIIGTDLGVNANHAQAAHAALACRHCGDLRDFDKDADPFDPFRVPEIMDRSLLPENDQWLSGEEAAIFRSAFTQLDLEDQGVLNFYYLDNLTYEEIGHMTGLTREAIRLRLGKATQRFYEILQYKGPLEWRGLPQKERRHYATKGQKKRKKATRVDKARNRLPPKVRSQTQSDDVDPQGSPRCRPDRSETSRIAHPDPIGQRLCAVAG